MNLSKTITLLLLFLLLLGCTPVPGEEPVAQLDGEKEATPQVAATKPAELRTESEGSDELEPLLQPTDDVGGETITGETVRPAEVDLAEVTPEPAVEGEDAVIQPEPGEPNLAQSMAHRATTVLAEDLGIEAHNIEVVSIEAVQWRDSSLGCPRPGQSYLTVITPGFRVILEADGERYEYHTDQNRTAIRCEGRAGGGGSAFPEK
jgi:hypothetical protein